MHPDDKNGDEIKASGIEANDNFPIIHSIIEQIGRLCSKYELLSAVILSRKSIEAICWDIYENERITIDPKMSLHGLIGGLYCKKRKLIPWAKRK